MPLNKIGRIAALDSVRGIAAFIVVIHHCFLTRAVYSDFFFTQWKTPANSLVSWIFLYTPARIVWAGYEAVTLFYVLSGLVLALPWVEERPPEYRKYAIRRMCRLYIPYVVGIVAAGVLNVALLQHAYVSGASQWVNSMTWTNPVTPFVIFDHFAIIGHHATINGVTHTLIWEIRVSLIFPLIIVPIMRWGLRGALAVLACLVTVIVALQLAFGDISAVGNLLIPAKHQGLLLKLAIELAVECLLRLFLCLWECSRCPAPGDPPILFAVQDPGWALCSWALVCWCFRATGRSGMRCRSSWWLLVLF